MAATTTLQTLLGEDFQNLNTNISSKIEEFIQSQFGSITDLQSRLSLVNASTERQNFQYEKELESSQSQLKETSQACQQFKILISEIEEKLSKSNKECDVSQQKQHESTLQIQNFESSVNRYCQEKLQLSELLDKKENNIEKQNELIKSLNEQLTAANDSKYKSMIKVEDLEIKDLNYQHQNKCVEQERDLFKNQTETLNRELVEKTQEILRLRKEKTVSVLELEAELDQKTEETRLALSQTSGLKTQLQEKEKSIERLALKVKDLQSSNTQAEEHFQLELQAVNKLSDLYKKNGEDAQTKINDLLKTIEEMHKLLKEGDETTKEMENSMTETQDEWQTRLSDKEELINELKGELERCNELLIKSKVLGFSEEGVEQMFPTASVTSKVLKSGMTLTQIYSEYVKSQEELQTERLENKRLNEQLQLILVEIEEKTPLVNRKMQEYQKALDTISGLRTQLNGSLMEQERLQTERDNATRQTGFLRREHDRLKSVVSDLSLQIRTLLKEIEEAKGGRFVEGQEADVSSTADDTSASGIITQHLVSFKNLEELLEKNQQLLAVVRDLSEQLEENEKKMSATGASDMKEQLSSAIKQLEEMQEERKHQTTLIESVVRQKEHYKTMVSHFHGSPIGMSPAFSSTPQSRSFLNKSEEEVQRKHVELQTNFKNLQEEFDNYRKEKQQNTRLLSEQLDKFRDDLSESRIQNAKLSSELEFCKERIELAQSKADNYKKEVTMFRDKSQKYSSNAIQHQQVIGTLRQDLNSAQSKYAKAEVTIRNLQSEKELLKATEIRLLQDKEANNREQQSHAKLQSNLQAVQNNLERMESEAKHSMQKQIDKLEQEISILKSKLASEEELYKSAVKAWEIKNQELNDKVLAEVSRSNKTHEELVDAYSQLHQSKLDFSTTQAKLSAVQNKLNKIQVVQDDGKSGPTELKTTQKLLTDSRNELQGLKQTLEFAHKTSDKYRSIAEDLEKHVKSESEASKQCKEMLEKSVIDNERRVSELEKELEEKTQELNVLKIEFETNNTNYSNQVSLLEEQVRSFKEELDMSSSRVENAKKIEQDAHKEREEQSKLVSEAQEQYQRELVQHADDIRELSNIREKIETMKVSLASQIENNQSLQQICTENQTAWESEKGLMQKEVKSMKERYDELQGQNKSLFQQLEVMSSQLAAIKPSDWANLPTAPSMASGESYSMEHLMEVVRYLRKEKELAVSANDCAQNESSRLKMKLALIERRANDVEVELKEARDQAKVTAATEGQYQDLLKKVEMLNLLTESNQLLREEKDSSVKRNTKLEAQVKQLEAQLSPLQNSVKDLNAQLDVTTSESMALRGELKKWQNRSAYLLEQSRKHDPEDFKRIQEENSVLKSQMSTQTEECHRLKSELSKLGSTLNEAQKELVNVKQAIENERVKIKTLDQDLQSSKNESSEHQKTILQVKKIARKYKTEYTDLKTQHDEFVVKTNSSGENTATQVAQEKQLRIEMQLEMERKIKEAEEKTKKATEETDKVKEDIGRLTKVDEGAKVQEERLRRLILQAKKKIIIVTAERDAAVKDKSDITKEVEDLKTKLANLEQHTEEDSLRVTTFKSQYECKLKKLESDLKAMRESRDRLEKQVEDLSRQKQGSRPSTSAGPVERASSTISESPLMANIRPLTPPVVSSGGSGSLRHPPHSHPTAISARSTPTASIKPMAIGTSSTTSTVVSSHQSSFRTATVIPTTVASMSISSVVESDSSPVTTVHVLPTVPQATVQPTPAVVPIVTTVTVAPSTSVSHEQSNAEVASSVSDDSLFVTSAAAVSVARFNRPDSVASSIDDQRMINEPDDSCSSSLPSVSVVSTSPQMQVVAPTVKRQREEQEIQSTVIARESDSPDTTGQSPQVKRIRMVGDASITVERASVVTSGTSLTVPMEPSLVEVSRGSVHTVESTTVASSSSMSRDDHPTTTQQLTKPQDDIMPERPGVIVTPEPQGSTVAPESSSSQVTPEPDASEKEETILATTTEANVSELILEEDSQQSLDDQLDDKAIESTSKSPLPDFDDKNDKNFGLTEEFNEDEVADVDEEGMDDDGESYEDEEQMPEAGYSQGEEDGMEDDLPFDADADEMADPTSDDVEIDDASQMDAQEALASTSCHPTVISDTLDIVNDRQLDTPAAMVQGNSSSGSSTLTLPTVGQSLNEGPEIGLMTPTPSHRPSILPRVPPRSEHLMGRQQLAPFSITGQSSGGFEDGDDSIVPSTPTLFVPRRGDGFAEAISSPHVPHGRFVFTNTSDPGSQPGISQLASQGALGVDDTRMDLSQFDEGSGRSVPTTPLQVSPPADVTASSEIPEVSSQSRLGDQHVSSTRSIPTITVTANEDQTLTIQEELAESSNGSNTESTAVVDEPSVLLLDENKDDDTQLVSSPSESTGIVITEVVEGDNKPDGSDSTVNDPDDGAAGESLSGKTQLRKPITWDKKAPAVSPSTTTVVQPSVPAPIAAQQFPHPPPRVSRNEAIPRGRRLRVRGQGPNLGTRGNPNWQNFNWRGRGGRGGPGGGGAGGGNVA